ncbi:MAG: sigma-70 family RNA polymerase sigma factor [Kofleriaceae bacterium]
MTAHVGPPPLCRMFRMVRPDVWNTRYDDHVAEAALARLIAQGRSAWPQVAVPESDVLELLALKLGVVGEDWVDAVAELDGGELVIARACATGDTVAIQAFEATYFRAIGPALRRMNLDSDAIAEVQQIVRQRLFVRVDQERWPRICHYAGRGELLALVRTSAVRIAVDLLRRHRREADPDDVLVNLPDMIASPELAHLREDGLLELKRCVANAFRSLSTREVNLLRLHLLDGLTVDEISELYRVHRVTTSRWLSAARTRLAKHTRDCLAQEWGLQGSTLLRVLDSIRSQIDLSLHRLLGATEPAAGGRFPGKPLG